MVAISPLWASAPAHPEDALIFVSRLHDNNYAIPDFISRTRFGTTRLSMDVR